MYNVCICMYVTLLSLLGSIIDHTLCIGVSIVCIVLQLHNGYGV